MRITKAIAEKALTMFIDEGKRLPEIFKALEVQNPDRLKLRQKMQEVNPEGLMAEINKRRESRQPETVSKIERSIELAKTKEELTNIIARLNSLVAKAKDKNSKL